MPLEISLEVTGLKTQYKWVADCVMMSTVVAGVFCHLIIRKFKTTNKIKVIPNINKEIVLLGHKKCRKSNVTSHISRFT